MRVAPDGNRVAMIVRVGKSVQLKLAAIRHDRNGFWLTTTTQLGSSLPGSTSILNSLIAQLNSSVSLLTADITDLVNSLGSGSSQANS